MIDSLNVFVQIVQEWSSAIYAFCEGLNFDLSFGDALLAFLMQTIYAFSVSFIFVLPFLVVYFVIKWLFS